MNGIAHFMETQNLHKLNRQELFGRSLIQFKSSVLIFLLRDHQLRKCLIQIQN